MKVNIPLFFEFDFDEKELHDLLIDVATRSGKELKDLHAEIARRMVFDGDVPFKAQQVFQLAALCHFFGLSVRVAKSELRRSAGNGHADWIIELHLLKSDGTLLEPFFAGGRVSDPDDPSALFAVYATALLDGFRTAARGHLPLRAFYEQDEF